MKIRNQKKKILYAPAVEVLITIVKTANVKLWGIALLAQNDQIHLLNIIYHDRSINSIALFISSHKK